MIFACILLAIAAWNMDSRISESRVQGETQPSTEHIAEPSLAAPKPIPSPEESSQSRMALAAANRYVNEIVWGR